jgi:hypothetical protein
MSTGEGATGAAFVAPGRRSETVAGQDGQPYSALGAVAGVAYVVALVGLRYRR